VNRQAIVGVFLIIPAFAFWLTAFLKFFIKVDYTFYYFLYLPRAAEIIVFALPIPALVFALIAYKEAKRQNGEGKVLSIFTIFASIIFAILNFFAAFIRQS
jgi:hypothetical protein